MIKIIKLFFLICFLSIVSATIDINVDYSIHQVVLFAVDGLPGAGAMPIHMPYMLGRIINKYGSFTPQMRTHERGFMGWISLFYGTSDVAYGCDSYGDCDNEIPSSIGDPQSIADILENEFDFDVVVVSQDMREIRHVISDRPVKRFSHKDLDIFDYIDDSLSDTRLSSYKKRFLIIHLKILEHEGASTGHLSRNYLSLLRCVDYYMYQATKHIWANTPHNTLFLLASDHGSHRFDLEGIQVPLAFWGQGVKQRVNLFSTPIETPQVAPTLFDIICLYSDPSVLPINQNLSSFNSIRPAQWVHTGLSQIYELNYHNTISYNTVFNHNDDDEDVESILNDDGDSICSIPRSFKHSDINIAVIFIYLAFTAVFVIETINLLKFK